MSMILRLIGVIALVAVGFSPTGSRAGLDAPACRRMVFDAAHYTVCSYDPARQALRLVRSSELPVPGGLLAAVNTLSGGSSQADFAMNGGMYDGERRPLGLFIERGRKTHPLNLTAGSGNFFLRPGGVFWVGPNGRPHIHSTDDFALGTAAPAWATQSGPLLLRAGETHPKIAANGPSRLIRNGVGVRDGRALFVISDEPVSFGRFARMFRDGLGCPDALYLDGVVSGLWSRTLGREDSGRNLGTFVIVSRLPSTQAR